MNSYNVYEKLYADTKSAFTIVKNDKQYSLGEYMRMKAGNKNLPAERSVASGNSIVSKSFSYIKEKLTVKNPPAKDRIIKKFPLRTAASALLSAIVVCSLALSFGAFSTKNIHSEAPIIAEPETSDVEFEIPTSFEGK
jgi:hypothetical protein